MTDSIAAVIVALSYKFVWFIGQAFVFWLLWNVVAPNSFGLNDLGIFESVAVYALIRVVIDPPKLQVSID